MSCTRFRSSLRDAALGRAMDAELVAHVEGCAECRRALERDRDGTRRLDQAIREALAGEPSPEFLSRLRTRLASEDRVRSWRPLWLLPVAAGLAGLALLAHVVGRGPDAPPVSAPPRARQTPTPGTVEARPQVPLVAAPAETAAARRRPLPRRDPGPPVLIPPGEEESFRRFVAGRRRWRLEDGPLPDWGRRWEDIVVEPIVIRPLTMDD